MGVVGVVVLLGIALLLSRDRPGARSTRASSLGLGLQLAIGAGRLRTPFGARFFAGERRRHGFLGFADAGIRFVFGDWPGVRWCSRRRPGRRAADRSTVGFVLAINVLPIIVFIASLFAVLYHLGVMQRSWRAGARRCRGRWASPAPRRCRRSATSSSA